MTYPLFEFGDFIIGQRISFGNDWDEVDFLVQSTHELNVDLFQSTQ